MKKYAQELEIEIYAYCLMSNHVHILIGNSNKTMSKFMQKLETSYAKKFNRKYERHGHVFNDRFLSKNIDDDERFKTVIRYILQNPMKAGMCDNNEYLWSSFKELVEEDESKIVNKEKVFSIFGDSDSFFHFVRQKNDDVCLDNVFKYYINDEKCIRVIRNEIKSSSPDSLCRLKLEDQKKKIRVLIAKGISINQLSRLTGLSRYQIKRAQ